MPPSDSATGLDPPLGAPARPDGEQETIWTLRLIIAGGGWKVDLYSDPADWTEVGHIAIERAGPLLAN